MVAFPKRKKAVLKLSLARDCRHGVHGRVPRIWVVLSHMFPNERAYLPRECSTTELQQHAYGIISLILSLSQTPTYRKEFFRYFRACDHLYFGV